MKPSDAELREIERLTTKPFCDLSIAEIGRLNTLCRMHMRPLVQTELSRRAKPESVPAELDYAAEIAKAREAYSAVLADTVDDAFKEGWLAAKRDAQIVGKAAAYGREQALKEPPTC